MLQHVRREQCLNKIAYTVKDKAYFFNQEGILCEIEKRDAVNIPGIQTEMWLAVKDISHSAIVRKAIAKLKPGDSLEAFDKYLSESKLEQHKRPQGLQRFITKFYLPTYDRKPDNFDRTTFDYIFVEANIVTQWTENKKQYIERNLEEICQMLFRHVKRSESFQKYGVSVSQLKISKCELVNGSYLEFVLERREAT